MKRTSAILAGLVLLGCAPKGFVPPFSVPTPTACGAVLSPPELETSHIAPPELGRYNSNPPTSGIHYGTPSPTGVFDEPISDEAQVHNLEHGHVVMQHRDLTPSELQAVTRALQADPVMMLMAPRPSMPWKLALTSWGKIQVCMQIPADVEQVIRSFVKANRDKAPESIP